MSEVVRPTGHRDRRKASQADMDAIRAEYLEAKARREASGRPTFANTAWCDCPRHQLPASLVPRGVKENLGVVSNVT